MDGEFFLKRIAVSAALLVAFMAVYGVVQLFQWLFR
jgi:hypothetical protein